MMRNVWKCGVLEIVDNLYISRAQSARYNGNKPPLCKGSFCTVNKCFNMQDQTESAVKGKTFTPIVLVQ